jgi:hypothetical protein
LEQLKILPIPFLYGALQMTFPALRITGFLSGWLVPVLPTFSLHPIFQSSCKGMPFSPT